jgi:hypothetical protein
VESRRFVSSGMLLDQFLSHWFPSVRRTIASSGSTTIVLGTLADKWSCLLLLR